MTPEEMALKAQEALSLSGNSYRKGLELEIFQKS